MLDSNLGPATFNDINLYAYIYIYICICIYIRISIVISATSSAWANIHTSIHTSIHLCIYLILSTHPHIYTSIYPSIHPFLSLVLLGSTKQLRVVTMAKQFFSKCRQWIKETLNISWREETLLMKMARNKFRSFRRTRRPHPKNEISIIIIIYNMYTK